MSEIISSIAITKRANFSFNNKWIMVAAKKINKMINWRSNDYFLNNLGLII